MRVFLTGGTGLVGSHAIERLCSAGHQVVALVRDAAGASLVESLGAAAVEGRVECAESWAAARGSEAIVHSAALITQRKQWDEFEAVNVTATLLAARSAAQNEARLVHVSSVAVYGQHHAPLPRSIDENAPLLPLADTDFYARSKRRAEETLWEAVAKTGIGTVALRPCVIYGERDRSFLPRLMRAIRFGIAPLIGRGHNIMALVYAGNVADAVVAAVARPDATGAFNVTNDGEMTQREFLTAIGATMGRQPRLVSVPAAFAKAVGRSCHAVLRLTRPARYPGMVAHAAQFMAAENPYRSDGAVNVLGWTPSTPPVDAVRQAVAWFMREE